MTIKTFLQKVASQAIIRDSEKENIKKSINTLSDRLNRYFRNQIENQFKFGSYSRGTALPRQFDSNSDVDYLILFRDNRYQPQTFLNWLKRFASSQYSSSEIKQSTPTIILQLNHINFELVPAIKEIDWLSGYKIPDKRSEYQNWMTTNPLTLETNLTAANQNSSNLIKQLIRVLKYWNANKGYPFESYKLEENIVEFANPLTLSNLRNNKLDDYYFSFINNIRLDPFTANWKRGKLQQIQQVSNDAKEFENKYRYSAAIDNMRKLFPNVC